MPNRNPSDSDVPGDKTVPSDDVSATEANSAGVAGAHRDKDVPSTVGLRTSIGSGLLAQQPTPAADETVAIAKVCPQCGSEYETSDRFCPKDGSPLRPKTVGDALIGRVIADRYLILARIGEGGMGRVYLAEHVKMTRQCAIKVMNPSLVNDAESSTRFAREASSAARILHPNVAAVFDYGDADKIVYLVMEYVDGDSLASILKREGALDPRRAIDLARQIADGLSAAHELGIVHRDLKPDNVIVAQTRLGKETPKVVDFGIAKAVSESPKDALTRSGLVIGTPEYMSPEQLLGDPVDARADIYSLGCILYQMLTGVQPFAADSREQMIRRRLHETPPHVRDVLPNLPRRLDTLIMHMLARSPADRLASAAEASDMLDPALALGGWEPSSVPLRQYSTLTPRSAPTVVGPAADPSMQPTLPLRRRRGSIMRIVGGTAIGSALLLGGLMLWSRREPAQTLRSSDSMRSKSPAAPVFASESLHVTSAATLPRVDSSTLRPKPVATPPEELAARKPLERFAMAAESGSIASVVDAYPTIADAQRAWFEQLFGAMESIRSKAVFGNAAVSGNRAEMPFTLHLSYVRRNSKQRETTVLRYRAALEHRGDGWIIMDLKAPQ